MAAIGILLVALVSMLVLARRMGMRYTRGCVSLVGHWLLAVASAERDTQWRVFWGMATGPAHHLDDGCCGLVACPLRHTTWLKHCLACLVLGACGPC